MVETNNRVGIRTDQLITLIGVFVPLIGTVVAMGLVWQRQATWRDVFILLSMYVATGIGITVGFHRMLTHHSFRAHTAVRFVLLALGCMAGHTDPIRWTAIHIQHHVHSDRADDPHTATRVISRPFGLDL